MWVKIDDDLPSHPKQRAIGKDGRALWLAGLCYANKNNTDGFIPSCEIPPLAALMEIDNVAEVVKRMTVIFRPCKSPVWYAVEGGFEIHDYDQFQLTTEKQEELNKKKVEAGRKGGQRSGEVRRSKNEAGASRSASVLLEARGEKLAQNVQNAPGSGANLHPSHEGEIEAKRSTDEAGASSPIPRSKLTQFIDKSDQNDEAKRSKTKPVPVPVPVPDSEPVPKTPGAAARGAGATDAVGMFIEQYQAMFGERPDVTRFCKALVAKQKLWGEDNYRDALKGYFKSSDSYVNSHGFDAQTFVNSTYDRWIRGKQSQNGYKNGNHAASNDGGPDGTDWPDQVYSKYQPGTGRR